MNTTKLNYRIIVEKEKQDNGKVAYVAYAPTLGISDFGKTIELAVSNMEKAIKLYVETLLETNQPVPKQDEDDYFVTTRKIEVNSVTPRIA